MKSGYINPVYKLSLNDISEAPAKISYSQWSMFEKCPHQWKLSYIDKLAPFTHSIATCFGTAFHETLQEFLTVMYTKSVKEANAIDLHELLLTNLKQEYSNAITEKMGNLKPMLPIASGGLHPGSVELLIKRAGVDIQIQAGGGVAGHPDGVLAGSKALKQAVDASINNIPLVEYAKTHIELQRAIEKWGIAK